MNAGGPYAEFAAQFVGTGVVRSHSAAEKSGIKGMRILLHTSAAALYSDPRHLPEHACNHAPLIWRPLLPCAEDETATQAIVRHEFNYLSFGGADDDWRKNVRRMRGRAPISQRHHHDATLAAIGRMREAIRAGFDNLAGSER